MLSSEKIIAEVKELYGKMLNMKNDLHKIPELGGKEYKSSAYAKERCKELGLEITDITDVAFFAMLDTGRPGKTVAYRADMDGLNMDEDPIDLEGNKKAVVSEHEGWCHACGHDAHVATLLTAAEILIKHKDELAGGKVMFLFEAGEENGASVADVVEMLKREKPDLLWSLHYMTTDPLGAISLNSGARSAGFAGIDFEIIGKGGHSSRPDLCDNPLIAMAAVIKALQTTVDLAIPPANTAVLSTCGVSGGGTLHNIIPDTSKLIGSMRFFVKEDGEALYNYINPVIENTAAAYNCKVEFGKGHVVSSVPIVIKEEYATLAKQSLAKLHPEMIVDAPPLPGSESLGAQYEIIDGAFAFVGAGHKEDKSLRPAHHNRNFAIKDEAMIHACELSVQVIADMLAK